MKIFLYNFFCCRTASAAASGSVRSLADDEDEVDSDSNDETAKLDVNDIAESSVWTNLIFNAIFCSEQSFQLLLGLSNFLLCKFTGSQFVFSCTRMMLIL